MKFTQRLARNSFLLLAVHSRNVGAFSANFQLRTTGLLNKLPAFAPNTMSSDKDWYTSKISMSSATKEETDEIDTEDTSTIRCVAEACVVEDTNIKAQPVEEGKRRPEKVAGLAFFFVLDFIMRKFFAARSITFPSMMGGCVLLFSFLVLTEVVWTGSGDGIFEKLQPGANLLAKWLPVFFVPGLAMLPTAPKIGSAVDVAKVFSLVIGGFFFTLLSTAYSVFCLRSLQGKITKSTEDSGSKAETKDEKKTTWVKPHSNLTLRNLVSASVIFGGLSIYMDKIGHPLLTPIKTLFMLCTTVGAYVFGGNLSPKVTAVVHPIVVSTSAAWMATNLFAFMSGSTFLAVLKTFKAGSLSPMLAGAGDLLLYMLGPAVCSLSIAMYSRKKLMKENLPAVLLAMFVSSAGGMFSSALCARFMSFPGEILRLSVLTRNVTTALSIALTQILGGNISIAASVVVMTGIFGATIGARFLNFLRLKDPVSRGLAMGAGAQGIGVASLLKEKDAMPFAAINMILTAFCSSVLISIPVVRETLKTIALGGV